MGRAQTITPPRRNPRGVAPAHPKHVLRVRMYAARVAWLDGTLLWHPDGRIRFRSTDGEEVAATPQAISRAQYSLYRIAAHLYSARAALRAEPAEWLAERQARLEWVKRVAALGDRVSTPPADAAALVALLAVEARHAGDEGPPFSPAALLATRGSAAVALLPTLLRSAGDATDDTVLLAALTLGALERAPNGGREAAALPLSPTLRAAVAVGRRRGLPEEHGLLVHLLAAAGPAAEECADRFLTARAAAAGIPFALSAALVRELLGAAPAEAVVGLCEALAREAVPLEQLVRRRRHELPRPPHFEGPEEAREAQERREAAVGELAGLLLTLLRAGSGSPTVVADFARYVRWALGSIRPALLTSQFDAVLLRPLRHACASGAATGPAALRLLAGSAGLLWGQIPGYGRQMDGQAGYLSQRETASGGRRDYLTHRWARWVRPALELVHDSGGEADLVARLAGRTEKQGMPDVRDGAEIPAGSDVEACRWVLRRLCGDDAPLPVPISPYTAQHLFRLAHDGPRARARLSALWNALRGLRPAGMQSKYLYAVAQTTAWEDRARRAALVRGALLLVPSVCRHLRGLPEQPPDSGEYLSALLRFAADHPGRFQHILATLARADVCAAMTARGECPDYEMRAAFRVAAAVTKEGDARFVPVAAATMLRLLRTEEHRQESVEGGLQALERFPALRAPLAHLFPTQTNRCLTLLAGLGAADHLGSDGSALAPLAALEADARTDGTPYAPAPRNAALCDDAEWSDLLALAPDAAPLVADYWHARWLLGLPPDIPAGVRHAAEDPAAAFARELAWLESNGDRAHPGIGKRIASLRERVTDAARLRARAAEEAYERMLLAAREAQMAAAEALLRDCYRARCEVMVAQRIGPGVDFNDDLVNATLIAARIEKNRKHLLRLLRARVEGGPAGARAFVAEHPKNREFLAGLAARGVNLAEWLAERPRVVRLPESGMRVRLRLERDPLRILQMGNPFGTCLSAGGFNAFSTVANACELNKRVLFATDAATGRIVARKLVGLTADGKLLGFHTYAALEPGPDADALRAAVRRHLLDFAARCGLETADEGTIPTLFCDAWYDDGARPWSDDGAGAPPAQSPSAVVT